MNASAFDEENAVLDAPDGVLDNCDALSVWRGQFEDGTPAVISCWKPTKEEWEEMQRTGRVWLVIHGHTMPPAVLLGNNPWS